MSGSQGVEALKKSEKVAKGYDPRNRGGQGAAQAFPAHPEVKQNRRVAPKRRPLLSTRMARARGGEQFAPARREVNE